MLNTKVRLDVVSPDNWRVFNALKVKKEQSGFVASNLTILARAFAFRDYNSHVYAIYNEDLPIGLLMQRDYKEENKIFCVLDQFMIAEQYQGNGFGKAAVNLWLSMIKDENKYAAVILCYKEKDTIARNLYLGTGFYHTGEIDEDEIIMKYDLLSH